MQSFLKTNDLTTYINKVHPEINLTSIKAEKNNIESQLQTIKTSILNEFIKNEKNLMAILLQNEKIYNLIKKIKIEIKNYKNVLIQINQHEKREKSQLLNFFELFEDDMSRYVSDGRWLIYSVKLKCNDWNCLFVMTNDFLFLGKEVEIDQFDSEENSDDNRDINDNNDDIDNINNDDIDNDDINNDDIDNSKESFSDDYCDKNLNNDESYINDTTEINRNDIKNYDNVKIKNSPSIKNKIKKYKLINIYPYSSLKIGFTDVSLSILEPEKIILEGKREQIKQIKNIYEERTYNFEEPCEELKNLFDYEKLEFLIETGQYEKLDSFKDKIDFKKIIERVNIENKENLRCLINIFNRKDEILMIMIKFVDDRIVNIVEEFDNYNLRLMIDNVFAAFKLFLNELFGFIDELKSQDYKAINNDPNNNSENIVPNNSPENNDPDYNNFLDIFYDFDGNFKLILRLLLIENCLSKTVEFISRRIFWRKRSLKSVNDLIGVLGNKLVFDGMDFKYILDSLNDKKIIHQRYREEKFKKNVCNLINDFINDGCK
ncbi:hypothetical protein DMUE_3234 [Dictyocoela muelleri]|nr:hypothetical protein DMUE_3234 [Dictyocoela muelleri]